MDQLKQFLVEEYDDHTFTIYPYTSGEASYASYGSICPTQAVWDSLTKKLTSSKNTLQHLKSYTYRDLEYNLPVRPSVTKTTTTSATPKGEQDGLEDEPDD